MTLLQRSLVPVPKQEGFLVERCKDGEKLEPLTLDEFNKYVVPMFNNKDYWTKIGYWMDLSPDTLSFNCNCFDSGIVKPSNWVLYDRETSLFLEGYSCWAIEIMITKPFLHIRRFFYFNSKHVVPPENVDVPSKREIIIKQRGRRHIKNNGTVLEGVV